MKIKLKTDYKDWYDHIFYPTGDVTYNRYQRSKQTRTEMFHYLQSLGFKTPEFGTVSQFIPTQMELLRRDGLYEEPEIELASSIPDANTTDQMLIDAQLLQVRNELYREQAQVVVHTDELAHCGDGKEVMSYADALAKHPDGLAVQYHKTSMDKASLSERLLFIGDLGFHLQYASNDWRSNVGDVDIAVTKRFYMPSPEDNPTAVLQAMLYPIYAIDFITVDNLAIDFNTAPGLDPIKNYISASEIYDQIEAWFEVHKEEAVS